jgi:hypothetical protein
MECVMVICANDFVCSNASIDSRTVCERFLADTAVVAYIVLAWDENKELDGKDRMLALALSSILNTSYNGNVLRAPIFSNFGRCMPGIDDFLEER